MTSAVPRTDFHYEGRLERCAGQLVNVAYQARLLTATDLEELYRLHLQIRAQLPAASLLRPDDRAFFARHLTEQGCCIGVFAEQRLIAYAVLGLTGTATHPLGIELGLAEPELALAAYLDGVGVAPDWRGNGLHRLLLGWRINLARGLGCHHVIATAAPDNAVALRNLLLTGLRVKRLLFVYDGLLRYLLHLDLTQPVAIDGGTALARVIDDFTGQQALLSRGYWGYALLPRNDAANCLLYGLPLKAGGR